MKRLLSLAFLFALLAAPAQAQYVNTAQGSAGTLTGPVACDSVAQINLTATGQIIGLQTNLGIYVCGIYATLAGTSPTLLWEYGTGTTCATGTHALSGTLAPTAPALFQQGSGLGDILRVPAGNALCAVLGGTTPSFQGWLMYAQF